MTCHPCIWRAYLLTKKCITYQLRDSYSLNLTLLKCGHNTIRYQGSKSQNNLPNNVQMLYGLLLSSRMLHINGLD